MAQTKKGKKKAPAARPVTEDRTRIESTRRARREKAREATHLRRNELLLVVGVLAITVIAYVNSLGGEFVYDDRFQILKNPTITEISNLPRVFTESVWQFMSSTSEKPIGSYYRPIFNAALILNYQFFGFSVFGWHLVSMLLHLLVTYLVYRVARQWGLTVEVAAAAAVLFGVHPSHSESVAWVSGLPDPLAGVFILGSVILYERYRQSPAARFKSFLLSIGLAFFAMLSKEVAIAFPVFILIRELLDSSENNSLLARFTKSAKRVAPFVAAAVFYLALRYAVLGFLSKAEPKAIGISTAQVILTIPSVLLSYVRMLFIPYPLAITYDHTYVSSASDPRFWASLLALGAILIGTAWLVRSPQAGRRALVFAVLFLLPVLNLKAFNHEESLIHDRYLYLPSIGFCILIAMALAWVASWFKSRQEAVFQATTALIAFALLVLTVNQNSTWQNDLAMANNALQRNTQSPFLLNYIGAYYSQGKDMARAEQYYTKALEYNPQFYDSYSNLGDIYLGKGDWGKAEQYYMKAVESGVTYSQTYYNLGVARTNQNNLAGAEEALLRAIEIDPSSADALYNLGWVYDQQNNGSRAEQTYLRALQVKPGYPEPRINLGVVLTKQGRHNEALQQFQMAQTYAPDHPILLYAMGDLYMRMNRHQDALASFNRLLQREPQHRLVHTSMGLCHEAMGNPEQAKRSFQRAIEVAPQDPYTNIARDRLAKL